MAGIDPPQIYLPGPDWKRLLDQTSLYAAGHVHRWHWRGSRGGVLPDGYDPDTIASEAIAEFLQLCATDSSRAQISPDLIRRDLERRVRRHVNRLHHRAENRLLRNEPDLAPVFIDDEPEPVRLIDLIPDPFERPDRALLQKEALNEFYNFKLRFSAFLGKDVLLRNLFELFCDGLWKPQDLAARLNLTPRQFKNLRQRFLRKWALFHGRKTNLSEIIAASA